MNELIFFSIPFAKLAAISSTTFVKINQFQFLKGVNQLFETLFVDSLVDLSCYNITKKLIENQI